MLYRLAIITIAVTLVAGCAGRMTADEFNRQFGVARSVASVPVAREDQQDTDEGRRFAARRYLEVFGIDRWLDDTLHELAKEVPEAKRPELFQRVQRMFPREELDELMIGVCIKYFTRRQLDAAADFYRSSEGRSIIARGMRMTRPSLPGEGPRDTSQDRRIAAQRYLFEIGGKRFYGEMMSAVARRYSSIEESETFLWQASRDYSDFERLFIDTMAAYTTRSEIEALARFHRSEHGKVWKIQWPLVLDELLTYLTNAFRREGITIFR